MQNQDCSQLNASARVCRVCGESYIGFGALCPTHVAELVAKQTAQNAVTMLALNTREAQQRAERRARQRTE